MAYLLTNNSSYVVPREDDIHEVKVGDFLSQALVTDTLVYEVIKATAKTITLRECKRGELVHKEYSGGDFPISFTQALPDPDGEVIVCKERKLRSGKGGHYTTDRSSSRPNWLRVAKTIEGQPVYRTDYRY